ncbi:helix-turn-helix domain-containing protein [Telmatospirillum sp. J64-1]|uniref:helix-turn-helix domain-containing protein n=1 Tax=Telmatospirillum sp. J64-1 TaxID=2502183 RepID=UPI00115EFA1D|nr:helix-turn-helix domain-containing protein [Telmatospirillum sp. J64-1]
MYLTLAQRSALTPLAYQIFHHMNRLGHISALDALRAFGITSASLSRRICDLEEVGVKIERERALDSLTGRKYTRYKLARSQAAA